MGANSKIEWTDHTQNFWMGCTKISKACEHCYAADWAKRFGGVEWGPKAPRRKTSDAIWKQPLKWDAEAKAKGIRYRVFASSLSDIFDNHPSILGEWRWKAWDLIARCQNLDWLLLTKRPTNWAYYLPTAKCRPPLTHVRLGVTIEDEAALMERGAPLQMAHYTGWQTFVSYEPAMGSVDWSDLMKVNAIGWMIAGGESGPGARPAHPHWFRTTRDQCALFDVPFLFKQWGEWAPFAPTPGGDLGGETRSGHVTIVHPTGEDEVEVFKRTGRNTVLGSRYMKRVGKKNAGRSLDGVQHDGFPLSAADMYGIDRADVHEQVQQPENNRDHDDRI